VLYFAPLVYLQNKELIDAQLNRTAEVIKQQSNQLRDASAQSISRASETARSYAGEYGSQVQNLIGNAKAKTAQTYDQAAGQVKQATSSKQVNHSDFPKAPEEPIGTATVPKPVPAESAL
jgi:hypothetical protein